MHQHYPCNDVSSVRCGILRIVGKLPAKLHPVSRLQKQLLSPSSPKMYHFIINFDTSVTTNNGIELKSRLCSAYAVLRNLLETKHLSIKKLQTWSISLNLVRTFTKGLLSFL